MNGYLAMAKENTDFGSVRVKAMKFHVFMEAGEGWGDRPLCFEKVPFLALQGITWDDASAKTSTWQRRNSLRACPPDQARKASERAPPASHGD